MKRWLVVGIVPAVMAAGLAVSGQAGADESKVRATLRDASGVRAGSVEFVDLGRKTLVRVRLVHNRHVDVSQFHGLHVHANDDPSNGRGCQADPAQPPDTWFVSADGHLSKAGRRHGSHAGDMPSPLVVRDGSAWLEFTTGRIDLKSLVGRAVILHDGRDNFGNVPTGTAPDEYTPNSAAAVEKTRKTGNAGDRMACGVIRRA